MVWLVGKKNKRGKRLRNIIASPPTEHPSSHIWKKALEPHSGHRTYNSGQIASNSGQRVSQSNQNISGRCEILSGSQAFSIYASTPSLILYFSTDPFPHLLHLVFFPTNLPFPFPFLSPTYTRTPLDLPEYFMDKHLFKTTFNKLSVTYNNLFELGRELEMYNV